MKKLLSSVLIMFLVCSFIGSYAADQQDITLERFVERYNDCMTAFYKAFRQKYTPVEAVINDGLEQFALELPGGRVDGVIEAGSVASVDVVANDATGSLVIMGAIAALSSLDSAADIMDRGKQAKHILLTGDPDITTTNGYNIEIVERFKSGEAKHVIITKLP